MTTPTIPTHSELRSKALAATPGPWETDERLEPECVRDADGDIIVSETERYRDASFIAAANPATVLSLLDQIAAYREALEPFARHYDLNDCDERHAQEAMDVPIGDLRRARQALSISSTDSGRG